MRISEAEVEATVPLTLVPSFNWTVACGPASEELQAETRNSRRMAEAILIVILQLGMRTSAVPSTEAFGDKLTRLVGTALAYGIWKGRTRDPATRGIPLVGPLLPC